MGTVWFKAYPKDGSEPFEYGIPLDETLDRIVTDQRFFTHMEIVDVDYHV